MTSPIEALVTEDLRELAARTGHPSASEPASGGVFREARGYALAQRARILLDHASALGGELRRSAPIYASRVARIVAASGLIAYSIGLLAAYPPAQGSAWVPEPIRNHWMAFFALLAAYAVAHLLAARAFRRRLAASALLPPEGVLPPGAPRIPERARQLVDRLDRWTVGATIAACCAFAPMFAYSWVAQFLTEQYGTWGPGEAAPFLSIEVLAVYSVAGVGVALLVGRACRRDEDGDPVGSWLRFLGSLPALAIGLVLAVVSSRITVGTLVVEATRDRSGFGVGASSVLAGLFIGSWIALRLRAREQARLASGEPSAVLRQGP
jgi:hypothetical protein